MLKNRGDAEEVMRLKEGKKKHPHNNTIAQTVDGAHQSWSVSGITLQGKNMTSI